MSQPLVSVLIPCYNVESFVIESISSILNQTYSHIEIIAINDCSTDDTKNKLEYLASKDSRIKVYHNNENLKLIKTLNEGIRLCSGKYIARMDSDDISLPHRIEKQVDFLEKNPDYSVVSTQFYTFKTGSSTKNLYTNPTKYEELQAYLLFKSGICHPAAMIRKDLFTKFGLQFEQEYLHVEDYALWSKALYCTKLANLNEPLLLYRVHDNQISTIHEDLQIQNKKKVFEIHCKQLGLAYDEHSLNIYASVAEAVPFHSSFQYLSECEEFIKKLIDKNASQHFCDHEYLQRLLSLHWLRLCANSRLGVKVLKQCFKSSIYNKNNYKIRDYIILYTKCLFRIEYKKNFLYKILFR